jgi:hypothetical protein
MKILKPTTITDAKLVSSTIAEDDYAEWSDATTYDQGDFVISVATHTIYRSLTASNLDNDPDLEQVALADPLIADPDPINWQVIGATDRWKLFDSKPSQTATEADNITVAMWPGEFVQGVSLFNVSAASVSVSMTSGENLLTNGTFDSDTSGWTAGQGGTLAVASNRLEITNGGGGQSGLAYASFPTEIGTKYAIRIDNFDGTSGTNIIRVGNAIGATGFLNLTNVADGTTTSVEFEATATETFITIYTGSITAGQTALFDNIYAWEVVYENTIDMQDNSVVIDWFSYFFAPVVELSEVVLTDLPQFANAQITVSIDRPGGNVTVGQVMVGQVWDIGVTTTDGTAIAGLDFSYVQNDEFGNLTTVRREATRLASFSVFVPAETLLAFDTRMRSLRGGVPAVFIGDEDTRKAAINYGILRDYRAAYQTNLYSIVSIETQGVV